MQRADLPEDAAGAGDRRPFGGGKPAVWEIRLHSLYRLGTKRQIRVRVFRGDADFNLGPGSEPGIYEAAKRDGM